MTPAGFPHSEISGSKLVCSSPKLIAAYRVLHRLLTPRHPPFALSSLIEAFACARSRLLEPRRAEAREIQQQLSSQFSCQRSNIAEECILSRVGMCPMTQSGGDSRDRTGNLRLAKPALSQLSYTPKGLEGPAGDTRDVGLGRLELPTSRLSGVRSNHLSYRPGNTKAGRRATGFLQKVGISRLSNESTIEVEKSVWCDF